MGKKESTLAVSIENRAHDCSVSCVRCKFRYCCCYCDVHNVIGVSIVFLRASIVYVYVDGSKSGV